MVESTFRGTTTSDKAIDKYSEVKIAEYFMHKNSSGRFTNKHEFNNLAGKNENTRLSYAGIMSFLKK